MSSSARVVRSVAVIAIVLGLTPATGSAQWLNVPDRSTPRLPDGKPNLSAPAPRTSDGKPDLSGIWSTLGVARDPKLPARPVGTPGNVADRLVAGSTIEMLPSADAIFRQRAADFGGGRPSQHCLPHSIPDAMLITGVNFKFVQAKNMWVILFEEFNHYRQILTDGRSLPVDPEPTWFGYSVGHWDGDTFVVETSGFNDQSWLDDTGHPHTTAMKTTERFVRKDFGHMQVDVTIDDPMAYAKPWTARIQFALLPDTELLENICENEIDSAHIGK